MDRKVMIGGAAALCVGMMHLSAVDAATLSTTALTPLGTTSDVLASGDTNVDGIADGQGTTFAGIADFLVGQRSISGQKSVEKATMVFNLPDLPAGEEVASATLSITLLNRSGSGSYSALDVFHSTSFNTDIREFSSADAEGNTDQAADEAALRALHGDASFTKLGEIATFDQENQTVTLDITAAIISDYASDTSPVAAIRLEGADQLLPPNDPDSVQNRRYRVEWYGGDANNPNAPTITIETQPIPEPVGLGTGAVALGMLLLRRGR
ncbi:MAG: hypothetical protein AAF656_09955 [Planctomycetota bacterium]